MTGNTYNIIRRLGLRPSLKGTKFIIYAVKIIKAKTNFFVINEVYIEIANNFNISYPSKIKNEISYAIQHRNESKSIQNFEEIFGYEYDDEIFTNKDFIEELARVINI